MSLRRILHLVDGLGEWVVPLAIDRPYCPCRSLGRHHWHGRPNPVPLVDSSRCRRDQCQTARMSVVGIDGCKGGWVAIALDEDNRVHAYFVERLERLLEAVPTAQAVAIDIPIGLPSAGRRRADIEARQLLGVRRSSVFFAPVRNAIAAPTHAVASAISKQITGHGLSRQSFALAPKILEAERWSMSAPVPVWEVHPEVSFTIMVGRPAAWPKSTWSGLRERQRALAHAGIVLDDIGAAGHKAGADDVLDAAAAAWSAARLHRGEGISIPDPPESAPDAANPMAIWA